MKMIDMGHKMDTDTMQDKNKMMYPHLNLNHKIHEGLKGKDVGDMCHLEIMGKIVSKSESDLGDDMTIEIHKMGYKGEYDSKDKDEYIKMDSDEKDKADEKEVMEGE